MSDPDDVIRVGSEQFAHQGPVSDPRDLVQLAIDYMAFTLHVFSAVNGGGILPTVFPPELIIGNTAGSITIRERYSEEMLKGWAWNLLFSAIAISAQAVERALSDRFGRRPLDRHPQRQIKELSDIEAAWTIIYMVRCAFAHNPFNPRWECKGAYVGVLRVSALGMELDTRSRNGQRLRPEDFGNLAGYMSLLLFLRDEMQRGAATAHGNDETRH